MKSSLSLLMLALLLIASCKKHRGETGASVVPPTYFLSADSSSLLLGPADGATTSFNIKSNVDWSVAVMPASASWLSVTPSSGGNNGKLVVKAMANGSGAARAATILVSGPAPFGLSPVNITVTQAAPGVVPDSLWKRIFGGSSSDVELDITQTTDGNYVFVGTTQSNDYDLASALGGDASMVVKLDKYGTKIWRTVLPVAQLQGVVATSDGGVMAVGYISGNSGSLSGNHGAQDAAVVRLDASGNIVWAKQYGGTAGDQGFAISSVPGGGYVITGIALSTDGVFSGNHGNGDSWIFKIDENGNTLWNKIYGGPSKEVGNTVKVAADGSIFVGGETQGPDGGDISGNHAIGVDAFVLKLDANGSKLWLKVLGGSGYESVLGLVANADGTCLAAGYATSSDGDIVPAHAGFESWLIRLDANGNKLWSRTYGGARSEEFLSIVPTPAGYACGGYTTSHDGDIPSNHNDSYDWLLMGFDTNGNILWTRTYGGTGVERCHSLIYLGSNTYLSVGETNSTDGDVSGYHVPTFGSINGVYDGWSIKAKLP